MILLHDKNIDRGKEKRSLYYCIPPHTNKKNVNLLDASATPARNNVDASVWSGSGFQFL